MSGLVFVMLASALIGLLALLLTRNDLLSPGAVLPITMGFCTLAAIYNYNIYGTTVSVEAALLLTGGTFAFVVGAYVGTVKFGNRDTWLLGGSRIIVVPNWLLLASSAFSIMTLVFYYRDVTSTFNAMGATGDWNSMMGSYRIRASFQELQEGEGISSITNLLYKVQTGLAFVFAYIGINNAGAGQSPVRQIPILVPTAIHAATVMLSGGRMGVIRLFFGCATIAWVIYSARKEWSIRIRFTAIIKTILVFILASIAFWSAGYLVGRSISEEPLDYITHYIGFSMPLFSDYLKSPSSDSPLFGCETFVGLYNFLGRNFGITEFMHTYHLEWRMYQGVSLGNVYTAFRYWLHDFGVHGMILVSIFYGVFYSACYEGAKHCKQTRLFNYSLLLYSYIAYGVFMIPLMDCLCATELVPTTILVLAVMAGLAYTIESMQPQQNYQSGTRS